MKSIYILFCSLLSATVIFAQPNDLCSGAIVVVPGSPCISGTTVGANDNWGQVVGCQNGNNNSNHPEVWYTFTATGSQAQFIITTSFPWAGNVELILAQGSCAGTFSVLGSQCGSSPLNATINGLTAGAVYYYTVSNADNGTPGTFQTCLTTVTIPPAPGQDCNGSATICNSNPFPQGTYTGVGSIAENLTTNTCFGGNERQSKWYKFTVGCDGTLGFVINPTTTTDDYDWSLWNTSTSACAGTMPAPIACNWSGCPGATGLSATPASEPNAFNCAGPPGPCGNPKAFCNETAGNQSLLTVTAGTTYTLLIDNFNNNGNGFSFSFRGTAKIGPDATFSVSPGTCGTYVFTKTCPTANSTFLWQFGDGNTSTAQDPSHTYSTFGNFVITLQVTDALGCVATFSQTVNIVATALPTAPSPQTFCSNTNPTIANLTATGTALQWYNVSTGGSPLAGITALVPGTYYVSQTVSGCESGRTSVTVTVTATALPTAPSPQTFCSNTNPTIANLTATGTALQWYNVATGGSPLAGTTALVSGTYYVSQTVSGCESGRASVTVTVTATAFPTAPSPQTFCSNTNPTVANLTATGIALQWYNVSTGGSPLAGTTALVPGTYYVSQTVSGCESGRTPVTVTITTTTLPTAPSPQTFCSNTNPTVANLTATGTALQWYNVSTGGSPLAGTTALVSGTYYVSQTVSGCESGRASVTVTVTATALPTAPSPQTFCSNTNPTIANLTATGTALQWYNVATGGSPLAGTTALVSGTYYVSQTVSGCESGRASVTVTVTATAFPTAPSPQTFCSNTNPTVANLTATGTALQWYNVSTGGSPLAGTTALVPGTYYVSQTVSGCESGRTPVTVTITTTTLPTAPSPQTFCSNTNPTVANLTATGTALQWYNVSTGGSPLAGTTALVSGTYYVSQTVSGCESGRASVTVTVTATAFPTAPSPQTFCSNTNPTVANLLATGTALQWYNVSTGGSPLAGTTALVPGTYYVSQTVSGCESGRASVTVTLTSLTASVSVVPSTTSICSGGSVTFTATPINGGSNPTYQWMINGVNVAGQTASTFTTSSLANGNTITVVMTSNDPCASPATAGSNSISMTITSATPSVSITSTTTSICSGGSVTFTATPINGGSNPTYQWMINGVNVAGQTASTFTTSSLANGNTVTVVMTSNDPCASPLLASSNSISITTTSVTPSISIAASTTSICSGGSVTFTATPINGGSNPIYQWMINGANLAGQTASTFTTSSLTNGNTVTVVMTSNDPCASSANVTSNAISITTTPSVIPSVSIASTTTSICSGGSVTFTATPTNGGLSPLYQWMINGVNVAGQTTSTFTSSTLANGNIVTVVMTSNDPCASPATATSNSISISITSVTPSVFIAASTTSICTGGSVTFTATPTNGGSNPAYQWMINGVNVTGQTASTFTSATLTNGNIITVVMTSNDPCASPLIAVSNSVGITTTTVIPSVSIAASTTSICTGSPVTFTATPTNGGSTPAYQWMINGINVAGQTTSTFTSSTLANGNIVTVVMTSNDPCASPVTATSNSISISVTSVTPSVSIAASTTSICTGGSITFTATPTNGGSNPAYQWMINGVNVTGQTASTFTSATLTNGNIITVVMTSNDPCASPLIAVSNSVGITTTTVIPSVSIAASTTSICTGSPVTFTATPTNGGSTPAYQWLINGVNVAGQTASAFTSSTLTNGNTVTVLMTSNDPCANPTTATSNLIGITTTSVASSVTINSTTTSICSGGSVTFTATPANGGSTPAYQWMINGVNVAGQTASTFTTSSLSNGNAVSVMMTSNDPCANPATATSNSIGITTTTVVPSVSITSTTTSICSGGSVTFIATATNGGSNPTYQWMINGVNVSGQTAATFTTTTLPGGSAVSVMMTSNDPCANPVTPVQSQSITITSGAPVLTITNPSPVCAPSSVDLTAALVTAGSQAGLVYTYWLDANATNPLTNPNAVMNGGTYYIKAQDAGGCSITKPVNVSIEQKINGIRYPDVTATANSSLQLNARTPGTGYFYSWSPSTGLNFPNIKDPIFINNAGLEYLVSITSPAGCVIVDTLLVKMIPDPQFQTPNVFVPKAWSPNGDGHNDLLFPFLVNITELKYFRIYNRWGQQVFGTNINGKGWDGIHNGKPQVSDVYTWTIEAVGIDGKTIRRFGNAVLLR